MWCHTFLVAKSVEVVGWWVWYHMAICKVSEGGWLVCWRGHPGVGGSLGRVEVKHGDWVGWCKVKMERLV